MRLRALVSLNNRMTLKGSEMNAKLKDSVFKDFDAFYGEGMLALVQGIINDLAPTTRHEDWWASHVPYDIIAKHIMLHDR